MKRKTKTMYMHTLEGKPATFAAMCREEVKYLFFAGGRHRVQLVGSLREIRRQQAAAQETARREKSEWADPKRYGYVLVEVPQ